MNADIATGAYRLWVKLIADQVSEREALDQLLQLLAGLLGPEDIRHA